MKKLITLLTILCLCTYTIGCSKDQGGAKKDSGAAKKTDTGADKKADGGDKKE